MASRDCCDTSPQYAVSDTGRQRRGENGVDNNKLKQLVEDMRREK